MKYAGLGKRIGATLLDGIIVSLVAVIVSKLFSFNKEHSDIFEQSLHVLYVLLLPILWYGYTLGKRMLSIRIVKKDCSPIHFLHSLRRTLGSISYLVPIACGLIASFGTDINSYSDKMWHLVDVGVVPSGFMIGMLLSAAMLFASVIMVAYRLDRRSIHDFIAGTCVIEKEKKQP